MGAAEREDEQALLWNGVSGHSWVEAQDVLDRMFLPFEALLVESAAAEPRTRVLDVGCGTGSTTLAIQKRLGAGAECLGIDISEPMLERARARAQEANSPARFVRADAEQYAFERASFDLIVSRFGVMFFDEPVAAFRNLRAALKRGGRLGFVCWQAIDRNPWGQEALDAVRAVAPSQPLPEMFAPGKPGPFSFADEARVRSILESSGFSAVRIDPSEIPMQIGGARTVEEALDFVLELGPAARFVSEAEPALLPKFREALSRWLTHYASAQGVWMPGRTLIVTARNL